MRYTPYILPLLVSAGFGVTLASYAWRRRDVPGAAPFAWLMGSAAAWALAYVLDISTTDLAWKTLVSNLNFPANTVLSVAVVAMALQFAGHGYWLTRPRLAALCVVPVLTSAIALTSQWHTLWRHGYYLAVDEPFSVLLYEVGPWYWVHAAYSYAMVTATVVLLVQAARGVPWIYTRRTAVFIVALAVPVVADVLFRFRLTPVPGYNLAPSAFALSGLLVTWALFRYHVLDLVPIARSTIVEQMHAVMLVVDRQNRIVDFNAAAQRAIGFDPKRVIGQPAEVVSARWLDLVERYREAEGVSEQIAVEEAGERRSYHLSIAPIHDRQQRTLGRLVVLHDVTELERAKEAAEAGVRAKATFLATMSHEIRTPLSVILSLAQVLARSDTLTDDEHRHVGLIQQSGGHLLTLLNDVLDMARSDAGRLELQPRPFDLHRLLTDLDGLFRPQAAARGLALRIWWVEGVPRYVVGDDARLRQVLFNLLDNALKFTTRGDVALWVERVDRAQAPDYRLRFAVADTGIGIAAGELAGVFEPFVQTESGRQAQAGTGLGLALSREIVRRMGGELTVRSEVGRGSAFTFDVAVEALEGEAAAPAAIGRGRAMAGLAAGQAPRRVLVVDDDDANRRALMALLASLSAPGAPVLELGEAHDAQDALRLWRAWRPDLVFLDMRLPDRSGQDVARAIKERALAPPAAGGETAIVALSASAFPEEQAAFLAAGCDDFVPKPYRTQDVLACLVRHLGMRVEYRGAEPAYGEARVAAPLEVAARLAACPAEWVAALRAAAELGDFDGVEAMIARLRPRDGELAAHLAAWAGEYNQEALLRATAYVEAVAHAGVTTHTALAAATASTEGPS